MTRLSAPHAGALLSLAATTLLIAGCGTSQPDTQPATAGPAGDSASMPGMSMPGMSMPGMSMPGMSMAPAADTTPVATDTVKIENFAYSPAVVTVKAGTTVTWTNNDTDPHTVTSMNSGPVKSPTLEQGQTFHYTFAKAGRFEYLCTIHPFMTATVVVTP